MSLVHTLRNVFLTGLVVFIPLVATAYVLWFGFSILDNFMRPVVEEVAGRYVPGVGMLMTLLLILSAGALARMALGRRLVMMVEQAIMRVPLAKTVYSTVKQASEAVIDSSRKGFKGVVLVEYPRRGCYVLGFTTGAGVQEAREVTGKPLINIFIPTAPNPTSGMMVMVPEEEIIPLRMSVEDGLKLVISGGFMKDDSA